MKKDFIALIKWIGEQLLWIPVAIQTVLLYLTVALWFVWRAAKWVLVKKPIILEEFPLDVAFDVTGYIVCSPYFVSYWIISAVKEMSHGKRQSVCD